MRKTLSYILYTLLLAVVACACSSNLDIKSDYEFKVTHLPVPKKLKVGETIEIRCTIITEGEYEGSKYFLRFFQTDGRGQFRLDEGTVFLPNDLYELNRKTFRLYFTSLSDEQQCFDITFSDTAGKEYILSFDFSNDSKKS